MSTTYLITSELTAKTIARVCELPCADVNQVFFYGSALRSVSQLVPAQFTQLNTWSATVNAVGYCDSVAARYACDMRGLPHWQGYGLTEFYVKLHDATQLVQI